MIAAAFQKNDDTRDVVILAASLFVATLAEAAVLALAYVWESGAILIAALHLAIVVALGLVTYRSWLRERPYALLVVATMTTAFFGIIAPLLMLLMLPLFGHFRVHATPFEEWYNSLFPKARYSPSERLYESILRKELPGAGAGGVVSFLDVIAKGQTEQKYAVIAMIARNHRPAFTPVLKAALNDSANEIRVQAATAIARLTDEHLKRIQELEDSLARNGGDLEIREELAKAYDDYAYSGLLDADHKMQARSKALELWMAICHARPEHEHGMLRVGRLLMRMEKWTLATQWWERIFDDGRATPQSLVWYLECLFRAGRIEELRTLANHALPQIEGDRSVSRKAARAVRSWATGQMTGAAPGLEPAGV